MGVIRKFSPLAEHPARKVSIEQNPDGQYYVVVRIPISVRLDAGAIVVDECELGEILLTSPEKEVLALLCKGLSNKEIALEIKKSLRMAKYHVESVIRKTGCRDRSAVMARFAAERKRAPVTDFSLEGERT
jgi:DNA-binding NarL/FixJ family response regulator